MSTKISYTPHDFKSGDILYADQLDYMNYGISSAIEAINNMGTGSIFNFKGSVPTKADLPTTATTGDVYQVIDEGINYAYNGTTWDAIGSGTDIDLSQYALSADVKAALAGKQNTLTAGENVTIVDNIISVTIPDIPSQITIDSELSDTSENPVQNRVIKKALDAIETSGVVVDETLSDTSINPVQNKVIAGKLSTVETEIDENVYTQSNMTITTPIGDITQDMLDANGGSYTIADSANKNAIDIIMTLLSPEKQPNDKNSKEPNMTLTTSYRTDNDSVEVGSYISAFTWTGTFTDGTYGYGSIEGTTRYTKTDGAGVTPTWSISYKDESGKTITSTNATGEVAVSCQITTSGEYKYGEFTWSGTTTASTRTPVTNKGNVATSISAYVEKEFGGTVEIKAKGVRYSYYYVGNDSTSSLDSNFIRTTCTSLGKNTTDFNINNTVADGSGEACLAIPSGTTRIVLAMPGNKHQLAEVKDLSGLGLDVKTNFTRYEIQVAGANGFASTVYTVFQMINTSGIAKTNYIITIS